MKLNIDPAIFRCWKIRDIQIAAEYMKDFTADPGSFKNGSFHER